MGFAITLIHISTLVVILGAWMVWFYVFFILPFCYELKRDAVRKLIQYFHSNKMLSKKGIKVVKPYIKPEEKFSIETLLKKENKK